MCMRCLQGSEEDVGSTRTSYRCLWATLWVLGAQLGSSARAAHALNHRVISPAAILRQGVDMYHWLTWTQTGLLSQLSKCWEITSMNNHMQTEEEPHETWVWGKGSVPCKGDEWGRERDSRKNCRLVLLSWVCHWSFTRHEHDNCILHRITWALGVRITLYLPGLPAKETNVFHCCYNSAVHHILVKTHTGVYHRRLLTELKL